MKVTIYTLLGMIKDGKAPKKVKYEDCEYYLYNNINYLSSDKTLCLNNIFFDELNNTVEILEENKTPEKLDDTELYLTENQQHLIVNKLNEIIDYLDYLKSKGE